MMRDSKGDVSAWWHVRRILMAIAATALVMWLLTETGLVIWGWP